MNKQDSILSLDNPIDSSQNIINVTDFAKSATGDASVANIDFTDSNIDEV